MNFINRTNEATQNNDTLSGNASDNEIFEGGKGSDSFDGSLGFDTVLYEKNSSSFYIAKNDTGIHVVDTAFNGQGHDLLNNIERITFDDKSMAFDFENGAAASNAAKVIGTLGFNFLHDEAVFGKILSYFDNGKTTTEVFQTILDSGYVSNSAGSSTNEDLVKFAFKNVVGSEATADQVTSLLTLFKDNGGTMSQIDFLNWASETEVNVNHVDLIGLAASGVTYTDFIA